MKMLLFWILVVLTLPSAAGPSSAEIERQTWEWMRKGDLAQIAWTVRYYREECRTLFLSRLSEQLKKPDPERLRWLNTLARAFRLEGMGRPNNALERHGLLWPITFWRGTMFEADGAQGEYDLHGTWDE